METFEELLNRDGNDNPAYFPFNWEYKYWGDKVPQDDPEDYNIYIDWDKFANIHHNSEKAKRRRRINEEARIKKSRFTKAKNGTYGYGAGWRVKSERLVGTYKNVHIPKHTEEVTVITKTRKFCYSEDKKPCFVEVPVFTKETRIVPARTVRKCVKLEQVKTKPYLKRFSISKKYYKKLAARKARKADFPNGAGYKKVYEVEWASW